MKYKAVLIVVQDMERSKKFYREVLGLRVVEDIGANVTLTGGIALQTYDTWKEFILRSDDPVSFRHRAGELYFEEEDIDAFNEKLAAMPNMDYLHKLHEYPWGQRGISLYDPDGHIIDIGEDMSVVVKRFLDGGLSVGQTAARMDVPVTYVEFYLRKRGKKTGKKN